MQMHRLLLRERPDNICEERRSGCQGIWLLGPCLLFLVFCFAAQAQGISRDDKRAQLPNLPEATSRLTLLAVNDPVTGKSAFSFEGKEIPPLIRSSPGSTIEIEYLNRMSRNSKEVCVDGPCMNMTNLHFHGLHVSPNTPQDDVVSMMAMPGEGLHYVVHIPEDQPPGLYWYHTHPHGESYQQSLDGMSGAIVIDGIDRYVPELRGLKERVLVLRDAVLKHNDPASVVMANRVQLSHVSCGGEVEDPERIFTVNGVLRPRIAIAPGEKQFWRIVNASPDLYADVEVDSENMTVVALDGMPLAYHDPSRRTEVFQHVLLAPAGRVEAIVIGPKAGAMASLRSRCVDTGAEGDANREMVLADLDERVRDADFKAPQNADEHAAVYRPLAQNEVGALEASSPKFTVKFTEDKRGFYINDKKYSQTDGPMTTVKVGHYVHWRVVNDTREIHPFHIHQVHFLVYEENGERMRRPEWMDTVNVAPGGSVDLIMDFTDPIIRGISLFHCHLLKHEDKGMMAKILFQ
jgi:FtsP/CotA-like multicopper oxidase with cupredoxin domain